MSVVARLLTYLAAAGIHALKWFVHEFLLLSVHPAAGSRLAGGVIGCAAVVASLRVSYGMDCCRTPRAQLSS